SITLPLNGRHWFYTRTPAPNKHEPALSFIALALRLARALGRAHLVLAHSVRAHLVLAHLVRALHLTPTARLAPAFRRAGLVLLASVAGCNPSVARVPVARLHPAVALHLTVDSVHGVGLHLALAPRLA